MSSPALSAPLHQRRPLVLADLVPGTVVRDVLLVVGGAALTGLLAQIAIPVAGSPVPVTGQTFGALTVGAALGWRRGAAALALYLVAGMAGMPWYAGQSSGVNIPSLGYVIGFVLAAGIVGALASRGGDRSPLATIGTMVLGNAVVYAIGVPYLAASPRHRPRRRLRHRHAQLPAGRRPEDPARRRRPAGRLAPRGPPAPRPGLSPGVVRLHPQHPSPGPTVQSAGRVSRVVIV